MDSITQADDLVERLRAIPIWIVEMMAPCWQEHGTAAYAAADAIESLRAENARLTKQVANLEARGIHTCHDKCQRPLCVAQRENERLREALKWYANPEIYKPHPNGPAFDRRDLSWHAISALAHKDVNA